MSALWCHLDQIKLFSTNPKFMGALCCHLDQTKLFFDPAC